MKGPYQLDRRTVDGEVTRTSPGNYALGRRADSGKLKVRYVGRADSDLNARLRSWVGKTKHPLFKYSYASSAKPAFEKECENYHDFDPPGNEVHPDRPDGSKWNCPRCDVFD
jgi:hypothetical protein